MDMVLMVAYAVGVNRTPSTCMRHSPDKVNNSSLICKVGHLQIWLIEIGVCLLWNSCWALFVKITHLRISRLNLLRSFLLTDFMLEPVVLYGTVVWCYVAEKNLVFIYLAYVVLSLMVPSVIMHCGS